MPRWFFGLVRDMTDKGGRATTPPGKVQKPKYADKKIVKAKAPKKK